MENFKPASSHVETLFEITFDDGHGNGYGFPCDEKGELLPCDNPSAADNLQWCREHPDHFARAGIVTKHYYVVHDSATGTCECGKTIELRDEYLGACECPNCGRWYNLFGQEVNAPDTWEEGADW